MDLSSLTTVIAELEDHVLTITLNRPERMNSFTNEMRSEFRALWDYASETDDVHVIVLRASGERAFSTGMDVKEGTYVSENVFSRRDPGAELSPKQNGCWKPLVCAVHGMVAAARCTGSTRRTSSLRAMMLSSSTRMCHTGWSQHSSRSGLRTAFRSEKCCGWSSSASTSECRRSGRTRSDSSARS
ncbi:hypothetical protein GCM10020255_013040 [Rhodococcus baikonurensis]